MPTDLELALQSGGVMREETDFDKALKGGGQLRQAPPKGLTTADQLRELDPPIERGVLSRAATNLPRSIGEFASNLTQVARHPIQTAQSLGELALGTMELLIPQGSFGVEKHSKANAQKAKAVGNFYAERYSSLDAAKEAFAEDPIGVMTDLSLALTGLGGLTAKAGKISRLSQASKTGKIVSSASKLFSEGGKALDPVNIAGKTLKTITRPGRAVGKGVVGITTGTSTAAIDDAIAQSIKEPYLSSATGKGEFVRALRGHTKGEDILADARKALDNIKVARGNDYRSALTKIKASDKVLDGSKVAIKKELGKLLDEFNVRIDFDTGKVVRASMNQKAWKDLDDIIAQVDDLGKFPDDLTAVGLDRFKRHLGDLYTESNELGAFTTRLNKAVKNQLNKRVPGYSKMTKEYETITRQIKEIESTLSLKTKSNIDSGIRKLTSVFKENSEYRKAMVDVLEESIGKEITGQLAGLALSPAVPRGAIGRVVSGMGMLTSQYFTGLFSPTFFAALSIASPRLVGEFLNVLGKGIKAKQAIQKTGVAGLKARQGAFQAGRASQIEGEEIPLEEQQQESPPPPRRGNANLFRPKGAF